MEGRALNFFALGCGLVLGILGGFTIGYVSQISRENVSSNFTTTGTPTVEVVTETTSQIETTQTAESTETTADSQTTTETTAIPFATPAPVMNPVTRLGCPYNGSITWSLTRDLDEPEAYQRIEAAMIEAVQFYECFTNLQMTVEVVLNPSVRTAQARNKRAFVDQSFLIEFGPDPYYQSLRTAMHELSHCGGVGLAPGWPALVDRNVLRATRATQEMHLIYSLIGRPWYTSDYGDDLVTLDGIHFTPFGLLSEWEKESTDHLIANCRMVMALRVDMGIASESSIVN